MFSVHFRGQVENGASLESSYDQGTPFKFKLGQCKPYISYSSHVLVEILISEIPGERSYKLEGTVSNLGKKMI